MINMMLEYLRDQEGKIPMSLKMTKTLSAVDQQEARVIGEILVNGCEGLSEDSITTPCYLELQRTKDRSQ